MPLQTNLEVALVSTLNQTVDLLSNESISYIWIRSHIRKKHSEFRYTEKENENISHFSVIKIFLCILIMQKIKNCILKSFIKLILNSLQFKLLLGIEINSQRMW